MRQDIWLLGLGRGPSSRHHGRHKLIGTLARAGLLRLDGLLLVARVFALQLGVACLVALAFRLFLGRALVFDLVVGQEGCGDKEGGHGYDAACCPSRRAWIVLCGASRTVFK